jgi:hypothetical protein
MKDELSYAVSGNTAYLSPVQRVNQAEYNFDLEFAPAPGVVIKPGIHHISASVPLFDATSYGPGAGLDRNVVSTLNVRNWIKKIEVEWQSRFLKMGVSYVNHNVNQIATNQTGFHGTLFPLANLNLYLNLDAYMQFQKYNETSKTSFIFKPMAGYKIFNNFWMEISGTAFEQFNLYDVPNSIAYNNLEKIANSFEVNGIIPLYRSGARIFIGYRFRTFNSYFFPDSNMLEPTNKQVFQSHLITGGIKWTK